MNPDAATVSVIIPTYNYAQYLSQAIESVLAQTVKPLEIIVADDGSTDNTAKVVARYGDAVRYRRFDHCGVYAVREAMLAELRGDWFLNLDADNWIEPNFLEQALAVVARHGEDRAFAFVYPDIRRFGDKDDMVPVERSRNAVKAIEAAGGKLIKYSELAGEGHGITGVVYSNPELHTWLVQQRRSTDSK